MALDDFVTNRSNQDTPTISQIGGHCDEVLDKLYRVDEHKRAKYKKLSYKVIFIAHINNSFESLTKDLNIFNKDFCFLFVIMHLENIYIKSF